MDGRRTYGWTVRQTHVADRRTDRQTDGQTDRRTQGVRQIEINEAGGQITINRLREVGLALDMQFVYGFVPMDGSIEKMIDRKAEELAKSITLEQVKLINISDT